MDDTTSFTPDSLNVSEIDWDASLNELVALAAKDFQSDMKSEPAVANVVVDLLLLMVILSSDGRVVVVVVVAGIALPAAAVPAFVVGVDGVTTVFSSDINRKEKNFLFCLYSTRVDFDFYMCVACVCLARDYCDDDCENKTNPLLVVSQRESDFD